MSLRLFTCSVSAGSGSRLIAWAITWATSTSAWNGSSPSPTMSTSAWVNSRYRPSWGRSPRHTDWIW